MTEVNSNVGAIARWVPHVGQMVVNIDFGDLGLWFEDNIELFDSGKTYDPASFEAIAKRDTKASESYVGAPSARSSGAHVTVSAAQLASDYGVGSMAHQAASAFYKSDTPNLSTGTRVRVVRSDKFEPFHGCEGVVVSVCGDRTHKVRLDGDAFARETYSFRREELVEVKAEEKPKELGRYPVPAFVPLKTDNGHVIQYRIAVELFRSDERVVSFAQKMAEWKEPATVNSDAWKLFERALRIAWDRNENGWRTEAEKRAERMFR